MATVTHMVQYIKLLRPFIFLRLCYTVETHVVIYTHCGEEFRFHTAAQALNIISTTGMCLFGLQPQVSGPVCVRTV